MTDRTGTLPDRIPVLRGKSIELLVKGAEPVDPARLAELANAEGVHIAGEVSTWPRSSNEIRADLKIVHTYSAERMVALQHLEAADEAFERQIQAMIKELPEDELDSTADRLGRERRETEKQIDGLRSRNRNVPYSLRFWLQLIVKAINAVKQRIKEVSRLQSRTPVPIGA